MYIVIGKNELIYIDKDYNIRKKLNDMNIVVKVIKKRDKIWILLCVYFFFFIKNFLIGMVR